MSSFSVTITPNQPPAVSITMSGNTTYQQFKNSLGNFVYYVQRLFLFSNLLEQIQGKFLYSSYDVSGRQNVETIPSAIDPYQSQSSIYLQLGEREIVLNGQDFVRFQLLANATISLRIFVSRVVNQTPLNKNSETNFEQFEESEGDKGFFKNYNDFI